MPTIHFLNSHKSLEVLPGTNLRKAALKAGVPLYKFPRRFLHLNLQLGPLSIPCASDVIEVVDGKGVNPRSPDEERALGGRFLRRKIGPNHRLACQVQVNGDVSVRTLPELDLDIEETKRTVGYFAALGLFTLLMALTFAVMAFDLVKKF